MRSGGAERNAVIHYQQEKNRNQEKLNEAVKAIKPISAGLRTQRFLGGVRVGFLTMLIVGVRFFL